MQKSIIFLLLASCFLFLTCVFCQTTYNLQIIFKKGCPPVPPDANPAGTHWGMGINGVGDVNKDGYDDIVVGAFGDYGEPSCSLFCHLFLGGNPFDTIPDLVFHDWCGGKNGIGICGGDLNKDGYSEVVIYPYSSRTVYVYFGGNPMDNSPDIVITGPDVEFASDPFQPVACGDINGDDTTDLIIGSDWSPNWEAGKVYVYYGPIATGVINPYPDVILYGGHGDTWTEQFGSSVGSGGDVNKDGFQDMAIAALNYGDGICAPFTAGRVYVYCGGSLLDTVYDVAHTGEQAGQFLGGGNVSIVKHNKLGIYDDGWWASPEYIGSESRGKCYGLWGGNPMDSIPDFSVIGTLNDSRLGYWTSSAGFANLDSFEDFWAGADCEDSTRGAAYLWLKKFPMNSFFDAAIYGRSPGVSDVIGARVAKAGDVDGDGKDEIMVGNYWAVPKESVAVWVCKYTGPEGTEEQQNAECGMRNAECRLMQNCPNPFSHTTVISYQLSVNSNVSLKIYNLAGQLVKTLVNELTSSRFIGMRSVVWDGRDESGKRVAPGVYFYRLTVGDFADVKKMILLP